MFDFLGGGHSPSLTSHLQGILYDLAPSVIRYSGNAKYLPSGLLAYHWAELISYECFETVYECVLEIL